MTDQPDNKAIVMRLVREVLRDGNLALIEEFFAPEYVPHDPSNPARPGGIAGARAFIAQLHAAQLRVTEGAIEYEPEHVLADGDLVAYNWTLRFDHTGPMMGVPPSGRSITVTGMDMFRLSDGKIVESWAYADALGMLIQMGAIPPRGPPPA